MRRLWPIFSRPGKRDLKSETSPWDHRHSRIATRATAAGGRARCHGLLWRSGWLEWHSHGLPTRFIKSQYEILNLNIECTKFERIYSSCTRMSNENLCSSSGATLEKENWWFSEFHLPWMLMYLFKKISPCVWPNSGYWWCLFLILRISLLFEGLFFNQNGSYAIARSGFECIHYDLIPIYGFMSIKFGLVGTFFPRLNVGR
jgi:hypothetical protein